MSELPRAGLDIVIVDYNSGGFVADCLESVAAHPPEAVTIERIVIVDNGSRQPVAQFVGDRDLPVQVIRNDENRGFAAACNQGALSGSAPYVLFLNPDTRLVAGSLDRPIEFLQQPANAHIGVVGVQLLDETGGVARSCSRHPRPSFYVHRALGLDRLLPALFPNGFMREWDHSSSRRVDSVMGAFYLVRRDLFERLGGFDERFFVYFEEADFSLRAAKLGYDNYYLAEGRAYHHGRGSSDRVRRERLVYFVQSQLTFGHTHFTRLGAAALTAVTLVGEPVARVLRSLWKRSWRDVSDTLAAYGEVWRWVLADNFPRERE